MAKQCNEPGCNGYIFSRSKCGRHQYLLPPKEKREPKDRGLFKRVVEPDELLVVGKAKFPANKPAIKPKVAKDIELEAWFMDRRDEMTGKCCLCGGRTQKNDDETYRNSIHHLFEKRPIMFPSVKTHPDNWLELCFYGNSCHTNIHNGRITWQLLLDSAERGMILYKVEKVMPFIQEVNKIPDCLLETLNKKSQTI